MQNAITVIIFALFLMLLSVLPAWERSFTQDRAGEPRTPIVVIEGGA